MSLIHEISEKIARVRIHKREACVEDKCQCYALALDIVALFERTYADDRNRLSQLLMERTDELNRMRRLVGEDEITSARASLARKQVPRDPEMDKAIFDNVTELYED